MPDEDFEIYWRLRGGPELVVLHSLFSGQTVPAEKVQQAIGLTQEQLRVSTRAAAQLGFIEASEHSITFYTLAPDSSQRGRLDWCLESHTDELTALTVKLQAQLLLRFLSTPPAS